MERPENRLMRLRPIFRNVEELHKILTQELVLLWNLDPWGLKKTGIIKYHKKIGRFV